MMTKQTFRARFLAIWLAAALFGVPLPGRLAHAPFLATLQAQATINTTTIAVALTKTQTTVSLTSGSTVVAGQFGYVDRELIRFQAAVGTSTTLWTVIRGQQGTAVANHAALTLIFTGPGNYFDNSPDPVPAGPCTATNEVALPRILTKAGDVYDCRGATATTQVWSRYRTGGLVDTNPGFLPGPAETPPTYTASGAITVMPGLQLIGVAGVGAMTLVNPTTAQNGMIMCLIASTGNAHTVTYTAGFGGGTTARDVATYGGAVTDGMCIVANNGIWWPISIRNVSFG